MKALIIYESMFGNTRKFAEAIAEGLRDSAEISIVRVGDVTDDMVAEADLLVAGGPTHVHGMSRPATREEAERQASVPDSGLTLEPDAVPVGIREWITRSAVQSVPFAAFDSRADAFRWLTGSAAKQIAAELTKRGALQIVEPGSFLAPDNDIDIEEIDRAREWGAQVGRAALENRGFGARHTTTSR